MTRDKAIVILNNLGFVTPEQLVDGLIALNVLKVEEPKTVEQKIEFMKITHGYYRTNFILCSLAEAGLKVVNK